MCWSMVSSSNDRVMFVMFYSEMEKVFARNIFFVMMPCVRTIFKKTHTSHVCYIGCCAQLKVQSKGKFFDDMIVNSSNCMRINRFHHV